MPSQNYIRWRDRILWPTTLATVPLGYEPVKDRPTADVIAEAAFAGLDDRRLEQYRTLWRTALDQGLQPSGLLLMRIGALAPAIGLVSKTVPEQWYRMLERKGVLHHVPGKLYPHGSRPGNVRTRCYLILRKAG